MSFSRERSIWWCAGLLLVLLSPVLIAIVAAVRLTSRGPAIFRQERAGRNGVPFTFYKFRTMRLEADPFGPSPRSGADPRLTRIGPFLREYSLDELPQLVNILRGDMSFVGPRPLYVSQIAEWDLRQRQRLLVKPGLTGSGPDWRPGRSDARREIGTRCAVCGAGEPGAGRPDSADHVRAGPGPPGDLRGEVLALRQRTRGQTR